MRWHWIARIALMAALGVPAFAAETCDSTTALEGPCRAIDAGLKMNDIQVVGTHNSYKRAIPPAELALIRQRSAPAAIELDYGHRPLAEQLDLGMRALEIDVVYDPQGGRYARPLLPAIAAKLGPDEPYDAAAMMQPGFKVMHVPDVDVRSQCATFVLCLQQIKAWSQAHPDHVPLVITMNAKAGESDMPGGVALLPFDAAAFAALDAEILSVFDSEHLVVPDSVRGKYSTLREGALAEGWPKLSEVRGKVMFVLDEGEETIGIYMRGHSSLEGLPMFVNSTGETAPHAAFFILNDPIADAARIKADVKAGFMVRTRADSGTHEARENDTARRDAAFASGAQIISTDYPEPRRDFGPYQAALPKDGPARCNPVRRDKACLPVSPPH
jgi:hypothetical protein